MAEGNRFITEMKLLEVGGGGVPPLSRRKQAIVHLDGPVAVPVGGATPIDMTAAFIATGDDIRGEANTALPMDVVIQGGGAMQVSMNDMICVFNLTARVVGAGADVGKLVGISLADTTTASWAPLTASSGGTSQALLTLETVQRLWRGDPLNTWSGDIYILPNLISADLSVSDILCQITEI